MPIKPKLTETSKRLICKALADGNSQKSAAILGGVSERSFYYWIELGEKAEEKLSKKERLTKEDDRYLQFLQSIKKAIARDQASRLKRINKAAKGGQLLSRTTTEYHNGNKVVREVYSTGSWQADAWQMERRSPDEWGRKERHEITGADGKPIETKTELSLDGDKLNEALSILADAGIIRMETDRQDSDTME